MLLFMALSLLLLSLLLEFHDLGNGELILIVKQILLIFFEQTTVVVVVMNHAVNVQIY